MKKPTMKSIWKGTKGDKYRAYVVTYKGKKFHHQSKATALNQFEAAQRVYKKRQKK